MIHTHLQELIPKLERIASEKDSGSQSFSFLPGRKQLGSSSATRVRRLIGGCALCGQIDETMGHYLQTVLFLWESSEEFRARFASSKGFCLPHFADLLEAAGRRFPEAKASRFSRELSELELSALRRIDGELDWFTQKFDYRNQDKPWGSSRDAVERAANKLRGASCGSDAEPDGGS